MKAIKFFTVSVMVLAFGSVATADCGQRHKLIGSDAAPGDVLGFSVGVSGNAAIAGAPFDDDAGSWSGSAYLFDAATGGQLVKLTADDAAPDDRFGHAVAVSGGKVLVGAYGDDDGGGWSGSAYLFDAATGSQIVKLTASDAADHYYFGYSVDISGDKAVVGAFGRPLVTFGVLTGCAYVFDANTGTQLRQLIPYDADTGFRCGHSVGVSGNTAIVGAHGYFWGGTWSGAAYLFDVTTGDQLDKLLASDRAGGDLFGYSVAISGSAAIVGAPGDDDAGGGSGSAYLFDVVTGTQTAKLTASDAAAGDQFGCSVAISGDFAVVGALGDDDSGSSSGAVYVFDITTGTQLAKLIALDAATDDCFGVAVAVDGLAAIIGANYDDSLAGVNSGSAYLFEVPEPACLSLLAMGWVALARPRRASNKRGDKSPRRVTDGSPRRSIAIPAARPCFSVSLAAAGILTVVLASAGVAGAEITWSYKFDGGWEGFVNGGALIGNDGWTGTNGSATTKDDDDFGASSRFNLMAAGYDPCTALRTNDAAWSYLIPPGTPALTLRFEARRGFTNWGRFTTATFGLNVGDKAMFTFGVIPSGPRGVDFDYPYYGVIDANGFRTLSATKYPGGAAYVKRVLLEVDLAANAGAASASMFLDAGDGTGLQPIADVQNVSLNLDQATYPIEGWDGISLGVMSYARMDNIGITAIPEPATLVLLGAAAPFLLKPKRKSRCCESGLAVGALVLVRRKRG